MAPIGTRWKRWKIAQVKWSRWRSIRRGIGTADRPPRPPRRGRSTKRGLLFTRGPNTAGRGRRSWRRGSRGIAPRRAAGPLKQNQRCCCPPPLRPCAAGCPRSAGVGPVLLPGCPARRPLAGLLLYAAVEYLSALIGGPCAAAEAPTGPTPPAWDGRARPRWGHWARPQETPLDNRGRLCYYDLAGGSAWD